VDIGHWLAASRRGPLAACFYAPVGLMRIHANNGDSWEISRIPEAAVR
jgi:hypothetical protein